MAKDHHFSIGGSRWLWRYSRLKGTAEGWTFMPTTRNPDGKQKILIDARLKGRARLDTEIHEFLHAANPTHSEEHVLQQASDLSRILWALGYRLKDQQ